MEFFLKADKFFRDILNRFSCFLPQLLFRIFLAYEFAQSGLEKLHGDNWFSDLIDEGKFPFPFNIVPAQISWNLSMGAELIGAVALFLGLGTRYWCVTLMILDAVAWISVHAGNGYNVCDDGWELPLIYMIMFVALLTQGAGKLSVDYWISKKIESRKLFG